MPESATATVLAIELLERYKRGELNVSYNKQRHIDVCAEYYQPRDIVTIDLQGITSASDRNWSIDRQFLTLFSREDGQRKKVSIQLPNDAQLLNAGGFTRQADTVFQGSGAGRTAWLQVGGPFIPPKDIKFPIPLEGYRIVTVYSYCSLLTDREHRVYVRARPAKRT